MKTMKSIKSVFSFTISLVLSVVVFMACSSDSSSSVEFSLSTESLTLNFEKGSRAEFQIITEGSWSITRIPSFVEVSKTHGEGTEIITVVARERNDGEFVREDVLTVEVDGGSPSSLNINVIQEKMVGCYAEPSNALLMSDGFAFSINCGPSTKYFYWNVYSQNTYNKKSKNEILAEITKDANKRIQPSLDGGCFSYYNASENTQYVIVTQSYAENDAVGEFVEFPVTTKSTNNQPKATLYSSEEDEDVDKNGILKYQNDYYFCWYAQKNSYCKDYYTYAVASKDKFSSFSWMESGNFPKIAFYIRQEIQKDGEDHVTSINNLSMGREQFYAAQINDAWSFLSCAYGVDKYCQVVTWGTNSNGDLSGLLYCLYWNNIDYSSKSRVSCKKAQYSPQPNEDEGIAEYAPASEMEGIKLIRIK